MEVVVTRKVKIEIGYVITGGPRASEELTACVCMCPLTKRMCAKRIVMAAVRLACYAGPRASFSPAVMARLGCCPYKPGIGSLLLAPPGYLLWNWAALTYHIPYNQGSYTLSQCVFGGQQLVSRPWTVTFASSAAQPADICREAYHRPARHCSSSFSISMPSSLPWGQL